MLRSLAIGLITALAFSSSGWAQTQAGVVPGFMSPAGSNGCPTTRACFVPYSATNPLPVDATVTATATTTATASSTPTSVSAGANQPLNIDLHSSLFVQPTYAGTPVDLTHGLPVNVVSGGAGTSSAFGAAFPANGTATGLSDGTNMVQWLTALTLGDAVNGNNTGAVASWLYNGATWDRARGDATNGAFVNVKTSVLPTGASTSAAQASQLTQETTTATNTGIIAGAVAASVMQDNIKQVNGATTLAGAGAVGTGSMRVAVGQDTTTVAGSAPGTAGTASANVVTVQGVASMTPVLETPSPATSGGDSTSSVIVPNNTTSVALKASAGQLLDLDGFSISAATPVWIKFYDAAQGSTTCGSGTPKLRYLVPGTGATGSGLAKGWKFGVPFATAITYCITAGIADNDTTAPAAATYVVNFGYK